MNTVTKKEMSLIHIFDLDGAKPQFSSPTGSRTIMNADNFPILAGMGAVLLRLEKGGVREPHWHPNAAELGYCITGNARQDTFTINPGPVGISYSVICPESTLILAILFPPCSGK
jgi:oxalate decarboxylase/phosphoglucose isomerase-like protein (cupin superfamily)